MLTLHHTTTSMKYESEKLLDLIYDVLIITWFDTYNSTMVLHSKMGNVAL